MCEEEFVNVNLRNWCAGQDPPTGGGDSMSAGGVLNEIRIKWLMGVCGGENEKIISTEGLLVRRSSTKGGFIVNHCGSVLSVADIPLWFMGKSQRDASPTDRFMGNLQMARHAIRFLCLFCRHLVGIIYGAPIFGLLIEQQWLDWFPAINLVNEDQPHCQRNHTANPSLLGCVIWSANSLNHSRGENCEWNGTWLWGNPLG